jgi:hypothetical protein
MKKRGIAKLKNLSEFKGKLEKANDSLPIKMKRIISVVFSLIFIISVNKQVLADKDIKPGKKQATLILSDGSKIILDTTNDTIVNLKTIGLRIKIDSTGVSYIFDDKKTLNNSKSKSVKNKKVIKSS